MGTRAGARVPRLPGLRRRARGAELRWCYWAVCQIGDVQSRSWIVRVTPSAEQAGGRSASGVRMHSHWFQRQLGFSSTRT